jgi:hypothetical protein
MSPENFVATQVRLVNGDIVEIPRCGPDRLMMILDESPPETEIETFKEGKFQVIRVDEIAMICAAPCASNIEFLSAQIRATVDRLKLRTDLNHSLRKKRAQNGLFSASSAPPLNCLPPPQKF